MPAFCNPQHAQLLVGGSRTAGTCYMVLRHMLEAAWLRPRYPARIGQHYMYCVTHTVGAHFFSRTGHGSLA